MTGSDNIASPPTNPDKEDSLSKNLKVLLILFLVAILISAVVLGMYIYQFHGSLSSNKEHWGLFGDYLGGALNPAFSLLAFIALLFTIVLQSKELKLSREELSLSRKELANSAIALKEQSDSLKIQIFENSFFQLIHLLREILENMKNGNTEGRICMERFKENLAKILQTPNQSQDISFNLFYEPKESILGCYFENLFVTLGLLDNLEAPENKKKYYSKILRAQISTNELFLIYYFALSKKFADRGLISLIEKYGMLTNLRPEYFDGILEDYTSQYAKSAFKKEVT